MKEQSKIELDSSNTHRKKEFFHEFHQHLTDSNQTSLQEPKLQAKTPKKREIPQERRNKQRTKRPTYPPPEKPPNQVIGRHNEQGDAPC